MAMILSIIFQDHNRHTSHQSSCSLCIGHSEVTIIIVKTIYESVASKKQHEFPHYHVPQEAIYMYMNLITKMLSTVLHKLASKLLSFVHVPCDYFHRLNKAILHTGRHELHNIDDYEQMIVKT